MANFVEEIDSDSDFEDNRLELGNRDGILFLIDATPPMFEIDPEKGVPYFIQCIRHYKEILKEKLGWSKPHWMGLTLFGTDKWDENSETEHILTLQTLNPISVDNLKKVIKIDEESKWKDYRDIASSTAYPLHDVLWYAVRAFFASQVAMTIRRVILFTCRDNPPLADDEKYRVRVKAKSYADIGLELCIVGLGENWNHDLFYKDLEILSGQIDTDDYERTSLQDLVKQVKLPSRNMANIPWRLGENVTIDVSVRNISVKTNYLKKTRISRETNVPLTTYSHWVEKEEEDGQPTTHILETEIQKCQTYGDRTICFQAAEVKTLGKTRMPGIDVICTKPIFYQPLYHCGSPYFILPGKSGRKDNKLVFGGILNKCDSKNLMIICAVTIRNHSTTSLYSMIPNAKHGGFYLYKIPFKENIRKLNEVYKKHIYDNDTNKPPSDPNKIEILEKMMQKLVIPYDPENFRNPKLQAQLQTVETLALDLEKGPPPPDDTVPSLDQMRKDVGDLLTQYHELFNDELESTYQPLKKRAKKVADETTNMLFNDEDKIQKIVTQGKLASFTIPQLKAMLKTLQLRTSGKKDELLHRISGYYI